MAPRVIMLIRHAENPGQDEAGVLPKGTGDPDSLTVRGWMRAGALASVFAPATGTVRSGLGRPTSILASNPGKSGSKRPQQTIDAIAKRLDLTSDDDPQWGGQFNDVDHKDTFTAWAPADFRVEYDELLRQVAEINARHVIVFTVPHVTIVPAAHGVDTKMTSDPYFARYTRPWITDDQFSPNRHPCLTGDELRTIDYAIDLYNDHIVSRVVQLNADLEEAGHERRWHVLDIAGVLDRLAYRRYLIDEQAQPACWTPYDLPEAFLAMSPVPDTRYFSSDRFGRSEGGLIGLDGLHPTTLGYSIIAREVMSLMTSSGCR